MGVDMYSPLFVAALLVALVAPGIPGQQADNRRDLRQRSYPHQLPLLPVAANRHREHLAGNGRFQPRQSQVSSNSRSRQNTRESVNTDKAQNLNLQRVSPADRSRRQRLQQYRLGIIRRTQLGQDFPQRQQPSWIQASFDSKPLLRIDSRRLAVQLRIQHEERLRQQQQQHLQHQQQQQHLQQQQQQHLQQQQQLQQKQQQPSLILQKQSQPSGQFQTNGQFQTRNHFRTQQMETPQSPNGQILPRMLYQHRKPLQQQQQLYQQQQQQQQQHLHQQQNSHFYIKNSQQSRATPLVVLSNRNSVNPTRQYDLPQGHQPTYGLTSIEAQPALAPHHTLGVNLLPAVQPSSPTAVAKAADSTERQHTLNQQGRVSGTASHPSIPPPDVYSFQAPRQSLSLSASSIQAPQDQTLPNTLPSLNQSVISPERQEHAIVEQTMNLAHSSKTSTATQPNIANVLRSNLLPESSKPLNDNSGSLNMGNGRPVVSTAKGILTLEAGNGNARMGNMSLTMGNGRPTMGNADSTVGSARPPIAKSDPIMVNVNSEKRNASPTMPNVNPTMRNGTLILGNVNPTIETVKPSIGNISPTIGNVNPVVAKVNPTVDIVNPTMGNVNPTVDNVSLNVARASLSMGNENPPMGKAHPLTSNENPALGTVSQAVGVIKTTIGATNHTIAGVLGNGSSALHGVNASGISHSGATRAATFLHGSSPNAGLPMGMSPSAFTAAIAALAKVAIQSLQEAYKTRLSSNAGLTQGIMAPTDVQPYISGPAWPAAVVNSATTTITPASPATEQAQFEAEETTTTTADPSAAAGEDVEYEADEMTTTTTVKPRDSTPPEAAGFISSNTGWGEYMLEGINGTVEGLLKSITTEATTVTSTTPTTTSPSPTTTTDEEMAEEEADKANAKDNARSLSAADKELIRNYFKNQHSLFLNYDYTG